MKVSEQIKATRAMMDTLSFIVDDIEDTIKELEQKKERTEAQEKLLMFAKHLQRHYL